MDVMKKRLEKRDADMAAAFLAALGQLGAGDEIDVTKILEESGLNRSRFYRLFIDSDAFVAELGLWVVRQAELEGPGFFVGRLGAARALLLAVASGLGGLKIQVETGVVDASEYVAEAGYKALEGRS